MKVLKAITFVILMSASLVQAQPQAEDGQHIKYFRDVKTGKPLEFEPEAAELLQNILVQQITEFCNKPENQKPGKCGIGASGLDRGSISRAVKQAVEQQK